jgi:hypothetical protein
VIPLESYALSNGFSASAGKLLTSTTPMKTKRLVFIGYQNLEKIQTHTA